MYIWIWTHLLKHYRNLYFGHNVRSQTIGFSFTRIILKYKKKEENKNSKEGVWETRKRSGMQSNDTYIYSNIIYENPNFI